VRQFLAVELPEPARNGLAGLRTRLEPACPGWRWVRPESIHLTLRFLGEVAEERDRGIRELWRRAVETIGPLSFRLEGVGCFPQGRSPRVLWVGVHETGRGGRLTALAREVELAAREAGFPAEQRPFRPHLTLARAARGRRATVPLDAIYSDPTEIAVSGVVLFRSDLQPTGARYTALTVFPLGGGTQG
jgi:2'-5' RNA ligase